jgi:hypothetical protein
MYSGREYFNVKKCALYLIKYGIYFASDLRIPPHAGRPAVHADGGRHLLHADAERPGGERSLRRRRLARRRRHLHRKVFHRGRTFAGEDEKGTRGTRKLTGENLKLVWAEFSTLSQAVLMMCLLLIYADACLHLKLKTQPRFSPVSLSLSMEKCLKLSCSAS